MLGRLKKLVIAAVMAVGVLAPVTSVVVSEPVMAVDCVDTNLFGKCDEGGGVQTDDEGGGIMRLLNLIVKVLLYGIGAAAVIGVVIAGIMYLTARDNEAQVEKSKKFLFEIVLGLLAWAMLWTVLNWLIPSFTGF